jgi:hypothetical protein
MQVDVTLHAACCDKSADPFGLTLSLHGLLASDVVVVVCFSGRIIIGAVIFGKAVANILNSHDRQS